MCSSRLCEGTCFISSNRSAVGKGGFKNSVIFFQVQRILSIFLFQTDPTTTTTMVVDGLAYVLYQWVLPTLLLFIISTLVLASFGKSLGVRRVYVRVLLKIFQVK